jgi:hypothetical protein
VFPQHGQRRDRNIKTSVGNPGDIPRYHENREEVARRDDLAFSVQPDQFALGVKSARNLFKTLELVENDGKGARIRSNPSRPQRPRSPIDATDLFF